MNIYSSEPTQRIASDRRLQQAVDGIDALLGAPRKTTGFWSHVVNVANDVYTEFDLGLVILNRQTQSLTVHSPSLQATDESNGRKLLIKESDLPIQLDRGEDVAQLLQREGYGRVHSYPFHNQSGHCPGHLICRADSTADLLAHEAEIIDLARHLGDIWRLVTDADERIDSPKNRITRRLRLTRALTECSQILLAGYNDEDVLDHALEALLPALSARRAIICLNNNDFSTTMTNVIDHGDVTQDRDDEDLQVIPFDSGLFEVAGDLTKGEIITGSIDDDRFRGTQSLHRMGLDTFVLLPLSVLDEWQGLLGFSTDDREQRWSKSELQILRAVASMFSIYFERENMGQHVRQSYETIRTLLNAPSLSAVLLDQHGVVVEMNDSARDILDIDPATSVGNYLIDALDEDIANVFYDLFESTTKNCTAETSSFRAHDRYFEAMLMPVLANDKSKVSRLAFYLRDITEQKLQEHRKVQHEKLAAIDKLTTSISREIETLLRNLSCTTRQLDESYGNCIEVLGRYRDLTTDRQIQDEELDDLLEEIPRVLGRATEDMNRMVGFVDTMKLFSNKTTEVKTPTDLNDSVQSVIEQTYPEWNEVAAVELALQPDLPTVTCVGGEIDRVMLNLVRNAAQTIAASGAGRDDRPLGAISVCTTSGGDWAEIRITDTGPGIAPEVQERIYEPFFTTRNSIESAGLGLAISHNVVVNKHNGSLSFETDPIRGTTFIVRIPINGTPVHAFVDGPPPSARPVGA